MLSKINKCDSSRRKSKFGKFSLDKGHFITESRIINELGWENVNEDVLLSNDNVQLEYAREKRDLELIKSGRFDIDACSETLV